MATRKRDHIHYSPQEEKFNRVTHAAAALASIFGLAWLLQVSMASGDRYRFISSLVFGLSLVLFYSISTLYHTVRAERTKALFRKLDHIGIYLLIAGTYTPITLVALRNGNGWTIFYLVWGLAAAGILFKLLMVHSIPLLGPVLYIALGWLIIIDLEGLAQSIPTAGIGWLLAGGVVYTVGILFYAINKIPHHHGIWHLFVVGGSVCHFLAVMLYVMPVNS